jgi:hypothetical protein
MRLPLRRRRLFETTRLLLDILELAILGSGHRTAQLAGPLRGIESLSGATQDYETTFVTKGNGRRQRERRA